MKLELINFKSEQLFPFHFQLLGIAFLFIGMVLILYSPYFAPLFLVIGALILTGYRGIEFDRSKKVYKEYNSFLFMKFGNWIQYDSVEKIFINSSVVSQKIYTRVTEGTTFRNVVYNAYLKVGDEVKLYLMSKKDKNVLYEKLTKLSDFFQIEIVDNSK